MELLKNSRLPDVHVNKIIREQKKKVYVAEIVKVLWKKIFSSYSSTQNNKKFTSVIN